VKKLFALMIVAAFTAVGCDEKKSTPSKITPAPTSSVKKVDPPPVMPVDPDKK